MQSRVVVVELTRPTAPHYLDMARTVVSLKRPGIRQVVWVIQRWLPVVVRVLTLTVAELCQLESDPLPGHTAVITGMEVIMTGLVVSVVVVGVVAYQVVEAVGFKVEIPMLTKLRLVDSLDVVDTPMCPCFSVKLRILYRLH